MDEVDEKVEKSVFWWWTVGSLSQNLAPRAISPGGSFQGAAGPLGLGLLTAFGGGGGVNVSKGGFNVMRPQDIHRAR